MLPPDATGKACSQCGEILVSETEPKRGLICVPCRRLNGRRHYQANRAYYLSKARRRNLATIWATKEWVLALLQTSQCNDCGIRDPRVLEFDHIDPETKRAPVSAMILNGFALATVQAEITKCEVRCANCHIIRTREQQGWWKSNSRMAEPWRARHDSNVQPFDP